MLPLEWGGYLVVYQPGDRRADSHGEGEEGQEGADSLARPGWSTQVVRNRPQQRDETPCTGFLVEILIYRKLCTVPEPHGCTDGEEEGELVGAGEGRGCQGQRAQAQAEEGGLQHSSARYS